MNCTNCNTPAPFHELRPFVRSVDEAKGKQVLCLECLWQIVFNLCQFSGVQPDELYRWMENASAQRMLAEKEASELRAAR